MKNIASLTKIRIALTVLLLMALLPASAQYKMVVHTNNGTSTEFWASSVDSVTWVYTETESSGNDEDEATVTGDASNITAYSATISSWANILYNLSSDIKIGIIYTTTGTPSKSNGTQETVSLSSLDNNAQYSLTLNNLAPSTTYYYRSFVYQSGLWFYGKVKSFTTKNQGVDMVTGVASKITCYSAIVSGSISINSSLDYRSLEYGICYSTSAEPTINDTRLQPESYSVRQNYTCQLRALAGNTTYYYRSYAYVDGYISYGPVQSFTTKEDNVVVTGSFNEEDCTVKSELKIGAGAYSSLKLGVCYDTTETPTIKDHTETANEVDDENNYTVSLNLTYIPFGTTVYYRSYVKIDGVVHYGEVKSFVKEYKVPVGEYVDLGLSVKWATFNVGATKPEEYGDYFAWGETEPLYEAGYAQENPQAHWKSGKSAGYSWSTYQFCKGSEDTMTKYCDNGYNGFTDRKFLLDPEDDAAHVNWGGYWRMPTYEELGELRNNCTWTWTTLNGVNGYKVQSKKSGYTDKWIFLPAAGCRYDSGLYLVGLIGCFWSCSLNTANPFCAYGLYFGTSYVGGNDYRYFGRSVRPVYCEDASAVITGISLSKSSVSIEVGDVEQLSATVSKTPGVVNDQVEWRSSNTSVATVDNNGNVTAVSEGTTTITARTVFGGFTAECVVTVTSATSAYEYVDLGLSVKWATMNVGATKPEEYGDYFAWGATEPLYEAGYAQEDPQAHWKSGKENGYTWGNTPYQTANTTSPSSTKWTKYLDGTYSSYKDSSATDANAMKTVLDPEDDAAHVNWGGSWRMPTKAEQDELQNADNCSWTWTTLNGVKGYKVQSKKPGYTDKWIFLPAAGYRIGSGLDDVGSYGYYWSSSLRTDYPYRACYLLFYSSGVVWSGLNRYRGQSVRPVCSEDSSTGITGISLNKSSISMQPDDVETLIATVSKNAGVNDQVEWRSSNTSVATVDYSGKVTAVSEGTATITAKTVLGGFTASCMVTVTSPTPTYEYVDLGLSVKWATMNVGATKPEEYGDYFAWGATEPLYEAGYAQEDPQAHWKSGKENGYTWGNTPYQTANTTSPSSTKWTKYLDGTYSSYKDPSATDANAMKTVLDPEDDAAHVNWGGSWRMPTMEEQQELRNNCSWTWTTLNGVKGYKVQSKKPGYTDKWIFLPAAGCRNDSYLYEVGYYGCYWACAIGTGYPYNACFLLFDSSYVGWYYGYRCGGQSVRPVCP